MTEVSNPGVCEKPHVDLPVVSLAQGVASLGKGGGRNFVEEEKRVTTRSRKKKEEVESSEVEDEILGAGAEKSLGEVEEGVLKK